MSWTQVPSKGTSRKVHMIFFVYTYLRYDSCVGTKMHKILYLRRYSMHSTHIIQCDFFLNHEFDLKSI